MKHYLLTLLAALMAMSAIAQSNSRIYIEDFEIVPDSSIVVPLILANVEESRGVQFYLTLPQGLSLGELQLTDYSLEYNMKFSCNYSKKNDCYMTFVYPAQAVCYPPDTTAIMTIEFTASPEFRGGDIKVWKCRGSTIDTKSIVYQDDTTTVTVPTASLIGVPVDQQPAEEHFFNLMGQPISSPDTVPVAIQVITAPDGQRTSRKVAVTH